MQDSLTNASSMKPKYKLLELYSGIGGMRCALEAAGIPFEVSAAVDTNPVVNMIYHHNFGESQHMQKNIESFTVKEIENLEADIITMSPPCQPFTRVGLKKDTEDMRSISFLHLLHIMKELKRKPEYFVLENVKGFELSEAKKSLVETLHSCGYRFQEFLLSPTNCGIPNSRLRYYIIAKQKKLDFAFPLQNEVQMIFPIESDQYKWQYLCSKCRSMESADMCPLSHFLEAEQSEYLKTFYVPDSILLKYWAVFDIVTENSNTSCCFTKAYGRYALGTGSILNARNSSQASHVFKNVTETTDVNEQLRLLKSLKLRYFTPKEIANILCFPKQFGFPEHLTSKQLYRSLGNSVNVFVVASVMHLLFQ